MQQIYLLSGLGADQRVFGRLNLPETEMKVLLWETPSPGETMQDYAKRFLPEITSPNPIIIGLSFGGMMALEISKLIPGARVILISSVPGPSHYPWWMIVLKYIRAEKFLPKKQFSSYRFFRMFRPVQNYFLGVETAAEKRMANEFRETVDPLYMNWAIKQVLHWKMDSKPETLYHIHGGRDHIFPLRNIHPTHCIKTGGHFMVWNRAEEVSKCLREIIFQLGRENNC